MNYAANRTRHALVIAFAIAMAATVAFAAQVPSLDEVYRTAHAGDLPRADAMMQQVLSAHPNSARAHYAYAQILAAEGRMATARSQLNQAEHIAPGLTFVSPQALAGLERRLQPVPTPAPVPRPSHSGGGIPWFWLLVGGGVVWFLLARGRRRAAYQGQYRNPSSPSQNASAGGYSYGAEPQPYGGGSGWWSSIISGLGFGAAAGAGQYAADRFLHRGDDQPKDSPIGDQPVSPPDNIPNNFGGDDFGIDGGNQAAGGWADSGADPASGGGQPAGNDSDSAFGMPPGDGNDGGWDDSSGGGGGTNV